MRRVAALATLLALAGCGKPDTAPAPGAVTAGEARALDEASEMLEQQRLPSDAATPGAAPTGQPAPR